MSWTIRQLVDRCVPPRLHADPETLSRARLFVGYVGALVATAPINVIQLNEPDGQSSVLLGFLGVLWNLACLGLLWLGMSLRAVVHLAMGFGVMALTAYSLTHGGPYASWASLFCLIPLAAFVLDGRRSAVVWMGVSLVCLGTLHGLADQLPSARALMDVEVSALEHTRMNVLVLFYVSALVVLLDGRHQDRARSLEQARDAADAASRTRALFLAEMSHEIRTPMNGVLGLTEVLLTEDDLSEHQRDKLLRIHRSGTTMVQLLNDLLDLSSMEAGKLQIQRRPWRPAAVLDQVLGLYADVGERKGLRLHRGISARVPECVEGDPTRVMQVCCNLLGNA